MASIREGIMFPATELDGKQIVVPSPATTGLKTWFTGAGDDIANGLVGDGPRLRLEMLGADTKSVEIQFLEPLEVHDGGAHIRPVDNWDHDDEASISVCIPANTPTAAPSNDGNCSLSPLGDGSNALVWNPLSDGTHNIDLSSAIPILVEDENTPDGQWQVDKITGQVTTPDEWGKGNCNLIDAAKNAFVVNNFPCAPPHGVLDIDVYKVEWVHQSYKIKLEVTKNSLPTGKISVWLLCFRKTVTK